MTGLLDRWRTSFTHPLPFDRLPLERLPSRAAWRGRLGMTHLPGKRGEAFDERHWRTLANDVERLRQAHAVDRLVLLVEDGELLWWGAQGLSAALESAGISLVRYSIVDGRVPTDRARFEQLLARIDEHLRDGESVAIACLGGYGRTGTVVACLLINAGLSPQEAIALTRVTRPGTIAFPEQEAFVRAYS